MESQLANWITNKLQCGDSKASGKRAVLALKHPLKLALILTLHLNMLLI